MTLIDAAALHAHLTEQINTDPVNDRVTVYIRIDGILRTQAGRQLHQRGTDLTPGEALRSGRVEITADELEAWIASETIVDTNETRRKVYAELLADLPRFTIHRYGPYDELFPATPAPSRSRLVRWIKERL